MPGVEEKKEDPELAKAERAAVPGDDLTTAISDAVPGAGREGQSER